MLAYPSPRASLLGMALVLIAAAGYAWQPAWDVAGLLAIVLVLTAVTDLVLATRALRGKLSVSRRFPHIVTVTQSRAGEYVIANGSPLWLAARVYEDRFPFINKQYDRAWLRLPPASSTNSAFSAAFIRRGESDLGGLSLRVIAGFGLWVMQYRFSLSQTVRVYPLIEEFTKGDLFAHRRRLYSIGQHMSRKFGRGTEFDRLREYGPDDEFRQINWKATARAGRPVVNQMQVEQSRDAILLLDCGRHMRTEIACRPRLDRYLDAAAHFAYLALSQRDRVGLLAFDERIIRFVPPGRRPRQMDDIVNAMFDLDARFVESDYAGAVSTLKRRQPKRGLVVLFTELIDSVSSRRAVLNLSRLAKTHLPVIVILDDPAVREMAELEVCRTEDVFIKAAAEQFLAEKRRTLQSLRNSGCLIVNVTADRLNAQLVNQYLQIKARNLL